MNSKFLLASILICVASISYAQTETGKSDEPAMMLMSEAPPQIEITFINGRELRARKVAELSTLDFKSITSFIFYYPDGDSDKVEFGALLNSLLNGSPNLEVLKFSFGNITTLPEITNINTKLQRLDLSHNKLESLSIKLDKFPNLEQLNLEDNEFEAIPRSLASLNNLKDFNFSRNSIDVDLFLQSLSNLKFEGILRLFRLGLTEVEYGNIKAKLKLIDVYH